MASSSRNDPSGPRSGSCQPKAAPRTSNSSVLPATTGQRADRFQYRLQVAPGGILRRCSPLRYCSVSEAARQASQAGCSCDCPGRPANRFADAAEPAGLLRVPLVAVPSCRRLRRNRSRARPDRHPLLRGRHLGQQHGHHGLRRSAGNSASGSITNLWFQTTGASSLMSSGSTKLPALRRGPDLAARTIARRRGRSRPGATRPRPGFLAEMRRTPAPRCPHGRWPPDPPCHARPAG